MTRALLALLVLLVLAAAGCSAPGPAAQGVHGTATVGPVCGGPQRDPPDPNCADRPFNGTLALWTADHGRQVATFLVHDGSFNVSAAPGSYEVANPSGANSLPTCRSGSFAVVADAWVEVAVSCDTGIR